VNISEMKPHPLAAGMPKQDPYVLEALERSLTEQGFDKRDPVVIWLDPAIGEDRILDGVTRRDTAVKLKIDRIPWTRFEGDRTAAIKFVKGRQLARRSNTSGQRAFIVAAFRKELGLGLEEAAQEAGCSISQMEKASAVTHSSKKYSAMGIRGEISPSAAAARLRKLTPEQAPAGDDPKHEIERTKDALTAIEDELAEIAKKLDALLDRRGGEMLALSLKSRARVVGGKRVEGYALVDEMIQTIKRNKPAGWCETCKGAACQDCGSRRYTTAHEKAANRNGKRD
jgi:NADH:ubiquinone oxidoreductase subunit E